MKLTEAFFFKRVLTLGISGWLAVCGVALKAGPVQAAAVPDYGRKLAGVRDHVAKIEHGCLVTEEKAMFQLINRERTQNGLPQLELDAELTKLAREKSRDMICYNYFGHQSERLGSVYDQLRQNGIDYRVVGENLIGAPGYRRAHQSLMDSPAHRGNILNPCFSKIGIGIGAGGPYRKVFTQILID
jgi:uncharacterized protein YkwD